MTNSRASFGVVALLFLLMASPMRLDAMCCPVPCDDCELRSRGQLNLVIMDRDKGMIRLIPNIRITGVADDFALIVPTPSVPEFQPVSGAIWNETLSLTEPTRARRPADGGLGCGSEFGAQFFSPVTESADTGVAIIRQETVGGFIVTVITSDDPDALITWLRENNFSLKASDASKFVPYVDAGWVFTVMRLDPAVPAPPVWDISVDPVEITFKATELEVPLPILSIHRADAFPMVFFVVDDHRVTLPEFTTTYANHISASEYAAIAASHPSFAEYLEPGRFLTRLDREFIATSPMSASVMLTRAPNDQEFRRIVGASLWGSYPVGAASLIILLLAARWVIRRMPGSSSLSAELIPVLRLDPAPGSLNDSHADGHRNGKSKQ